MLTFILLEFERAAITASVFDDLTGTTVLTWLAGGGLFTAVGYVGKSWFERNILRGVAKKEEATAAEIVAGAAAELVNPLRAELNITRRELSEVRTELRQVTVEMHTLSGQLSTEHHRNELLERRNTQLERENVELREKLTTGSNGKKE